MLTDATAFKNSVFCWEKSDLILLLSYFLTFLYFHLWSFVALSFLHFWRWPLWFRFHPCRSWPTDLQWGETISSMTLAHVFVAEYHHLSLCPLWLWWRCNSVKILSFWSLAIPLFQRSFLSSSAQRMLSWLKCTKEGVVHVLTELHSMDSFCEELLLHHEDLRSTDLLR